MDPLTIECQACGSKPHQPCTNYHGKPKAHCRRRKEDAGSVAKCRQQSAKRAAARRKAERAALPLLAWAGLLGGGPVPE